MRTRALLSAAACLLLLAGGLSGCAASLTPPTIVLTLATPEFDKDRFLEVQQLKHFVEQVTLGSSGTLVIDVNWGAGGRDTQRLDQITAGRVMSGADDLGLIPARAWDELGVTSLRPLSSPFLVTDDRLLARVVDDDALRGDLLSGLEAAGVVGLDLWPVQLRHVFGFDAELTGAETLEGQSIRAPLSQVEWAVIQSWGARPVFGPIDSGSQAGMESSFNLTGAGTVAGNVTPFAKAITLVAASPVRDRLTQAQWDVLVAAAAETREWADTERPSDLEAAADYCSAGGRIIAATESELADLESRARGVEQALREDPSTSLLIDRIAAMKAEQDPATPLTSCPGQPSNSGVEAGASAPIDGVYVVDVTIAELEAAGVLAAHRAENAGHFKWTLDRGHYHLHQTADHYISEPEMDGPYKYDVSTRVLTFDWEGADFIWGGTVRLKHNVLTWSKLFDTSADPDDPRLDSVWLKPWKRVGEPPSKTFESPPVGNFAVARRSMQGR